MIMHVITNFTASAGAETMLARLLHGATDERIVVVSLIGVSERNRRLADNPRVVYVSLGAASLTALPGAILRLARLIRKEQPDVILCWMYHAMVAGTLAAGMARHGAPVFWNVRQSLDDPASLTRSSRVAIAAAKLLSHRPTGIIYNSARALDLHRAYGYANRNAVVIPNGFDLPQLAAPEPRTARRDRYCRPLPPTERSRNFLQGCRSGGEDPPAGRLFRSRKRARPRQPGGHRADDTSRSSGPRRRSPGEISDMPAFYQSIDLLVLSSRTEGFPNVIAEAMSFGKPIVTTDVGDAAAVAGKAGIAVPARDPQALADAMRAFLDLPEAEYARYARTARERIENEYAIAAVTTKYSEFLMA
ncbi:glycosyltransferase [Sinorhizobium meliloti]|nr:glycosyltransferase [Sinorhizobium meliloti]